MDTPMLSTLQAQDRPTPMKGDASSQATRDNHSIPDTKRVSARINRRYNANSLNVWSRSGVRTWHTGSSGMRTPTSRRIAHDALPLDFLKQRLGTFLEAGSTSVYCKHPEARPGLHRSLQRLRVCARSYVSVVRWTLSTPGDERPELFGSAKALDLPAEYVADRERNKAALLCGDGSTCLLGRGTSFQSWCMFPADDAHNAPTTARVRSPNLAPQEETCSACGWRLSADSHKVCGSCASLHN